MSINRADASAAESQATPRALWLISGLIVCGLLLGSAILVLRLSSGRPGSVELALPLRLSLSLPSSLSLGSTPDHPFGLTIAPDGRRLAYPATHEGRVAIWLHDLTTGEARALPGTEGGQLPFWSPDGRRLGFFGGRRLHVLSLDAGTAEDLGDAPAPGGAVFLSNGDIIVARRQDEGLVRYDAARRTFGPHSHLDAAGGEISHRLPAVTTGGEHLLFYVSADRPGRRGIWIAAIDRPDDRRRLIGSEAQGIVAGDLMLYANDGALLAQRLDARSGVLGGTPALIAASVGVGPDNQLFAAASLGGPLVYWPPAVHARELVWTDRSGRVLGTLAEPVSAWEMRVSPDGRRTAVTELDSQLATLDVWIYEGAEPVPRRISPALDVDEGPVWAPDGARLAWTSARTTVMVRGAQAMLPEVRLRRFEQPARVWDWSADDRWLVLGLREEGTKDDLWLLDPRRAENPVAYARSAFSEINAAVSPDGRWLAYASDESGRFEIYADAFPNASGRRVQLTMGGGAEPRWRRDARELVFRRGGSLYSVAVKPSAGRLTASNTSMLFESSAGLRAWDMTMDGERFLLNVPAAGREAPPLHVVVHWYADALGAVEGAKSEGKAQNR